LRAAIAAHRVVARFSGAAHVELRVVEIEVPFAAMAAVRL
jgi:hypothetical protein